MPRLFFALWPDDATRDALSGRRDAIAFAYGGKPMLPATLHLTLAFIGEANELQVPTLLSCGDHVRAPEFSLTIDAVSHFKRAHLAWLGATEWPAELIHLFDVLRNEVTQAGFALDDQPFNPHITVVRKCVHYPSPAPVLPLAWKVESFVLVDSRQTPSGPLYRVLKYWPLESKSAVTSEAPLTGP